MEAWSLAPPWSMGCDLSALKFRALGLKIWLLQHEQVVLRMAILFGSLESRLLYRLSQYCTQGTQIPSATSLIGGCREATCKAMTIQRHNEGERICHKTEPRSS